MRIVPSPPSSALEALMAAPSHDGISNDAVIVINPGGANGRVVLSSTTDGRNTSTSGVVQLSSVIFRAIDLFISVSLLIAMQVTYWDTWGDECDRNLKVWSTGWISIQSVRALIACIQALVLRYSSHTSHWRWIIGSTQTPLFGLVGLGWFMYGIYPLFVMKGQYCNRFSKGWSIFGWSLQAITYFLPCLLVILCIPVLVTIMYIPWIRDYIFPHLMGSMAPSTNQEPTPQELLDKLQTTTFGEALDRNLIDAKSSTPPPVSGQDRTGQAGANNLEQQILPSALLPETLHNAMNSLITKINGVTPENLPDGTGQQIGGGPFSSMACPICVMEFERSDEITVLPCDPRRHIYHSECIKEWLNKSQHCPICRKNVAEILADHHPS